MSVIQTGHSGGELEPVVVGGAKIGTVELL